MGKTELSGRDNWQEHSGASALIAEQNLYEVFNKHFEGTNFILHEKPKHLKNLYARVQLPDNILEQIYNPNIYL